MSSSPASDYVLGFAFDESLSHVVLLQKLKPAWAAGMWNGLGGKIETQDQTPYHAMQREFMEECGVLIAAHEWQYLGAFTRPEWNVKCFCSQSDKIFDAKTMEKEQVTVYPVQDFMVKTITQPDLHGGLECAWLVPYARRFLLKPELRNDFKSSLLAGDPAMMPPTPPSKGFKP